MKQSKLKHFSLNLHKYIVIVIGLGELSIIIYICSWGTESGFEHPNA